MGSTDQVHHLLKLSKQLVKAAEKRGGLKAEFASLERPQKTKRPSPKGTELGRQIQRLSRRIEELVAAIAAPAPRRVERWVGVMPVTLLVESDGRKYEQIASTVDLSKRGLRIRTTAALSQGQILDVICKRWHLGHCRVVWVAPAGFDRPSEVGLEILNRPLPERCGP